MPYTRLLIHAVWATKYRRPLMSKENKDSLCFHLRANARKKAIMLLNVNGWLDHLHVLLRLHPSQQLDQVMQLLKGESSHWARRNLVWPEEFEWQDEYFAVAVSPSHLERVSRYIDRQETHHQRTSFDLEHAALSRIVNG